MTTTLGVRVLVFLWTNCVAAGQFIDICENDSLPDVCLPLSPHELRSTTEGPLSNQLVTTSLDLPSTLETPRNFIANLGNVIDDDNNGNPFVRKETLFRGILPPRREIICTVDDTLHEYGTNPICDRFQWILSDNEAELKWDNPTQRHRVRRQVMGQRAPLTRQERQQLQRLYGDKFNLEAAEAVKAMGMAVESPNFYKQPHQRGRQQSQQSFPGRNYPYRKERVYDQRFRRVAPSGRMQRQTYRQPPYSSNDYETDPTPDNSLNMDDECSLYGTWLSPLAGVAIELQQADGGNVAVTLDELPDAKTRFISSSWTGSVMLSPISPDTITILFQETGTSTPGTAVFSGQCVQCDGGNAIQGSWVIFSGHKQCQSGMKIANGTTRASAERLYRRYLYARN